MTFYAGRTLLVTGGTGSFGRTMVEHFLKTDIERIVVFSRDEKKQFDMQVELGDPRLHYVLGDVRDYGSIRAALVDVDYVFHAAALKQVPSCERQPDEAFKTNVLGADNVMRAAIDAQAHKVVLLSTDKAVYPVSAMGMSKAMMEKLMLARSLESRVTTICATRYGNVMGSRGSVIPLFVKQLLEGKPLTVTNGGMTRFLMSLQESVDLVLHAFACGGPGDLFVRKADACTIEDLAAAVREIVGEPTSPIVVTGTRPGERMHETLLSQEEMARAVSHEQYFRVPRDTGGFSGSWVPYASNNSYRLRGPMLRNVIRPVVEEVLACSR
jgi:UDP-glucose 4-epimerase